MTEKTFKDLLRQIEDNTEPVNNISEIANMMKDIVAYDRNMSVDNKMKFLFLYIQHRNECALLTTPHSKIQENKLSCFDKLKKKLYKYKTKPLYIILLIIMFLIFYNK